MATNRAKYVRAVSIRSPVALCTSYCTGYHLLYSTYLSSELLVARTCARLILLDGDSSFHGVLQVTSLQGGAVPQGGEAQT